jgi:hypothetical protein
VHSLPNRGGRCIIPPFFPDQDFAFPLFGTAISHRNVFQAPEGNRAPNSALGIWSLLPASSDKAESSTIVGPKGYSPEIGTLTSMMAFMWSRSCLLSRASQQDLDFLLDAKLQPDLHFMHLAAVEAFYQVNTFDGLSKKNARRVQKNGAYAWISVIPPCGHQNNSLTTI